MARVTVALGQGGTIMMNSKHIASLVGPTIVVMVVSEFPLVQPHLYDAQIPPVVYLSGVLMFIGGLAIIRAHNGWERDWTMLVTSSALIGASSSTLPIRIKGYGFSVMDLLKSSGPQV